MSFIQDKLYPLLPVPIQNIGISAFGYQWYKRRFSGIFDEEYKGFKERENFTQQQWLDYQTQQLRKLLLHSYNTVPYYKGTFSQSGISSNQLSKFEIGQLPLLPQLEKNTLRKRGKTELLSSIKEKGGSFYSSSGSTGTPTSILYSCNMHQKLSALYEARVRNWAGVTRYDARGMIGGRRVFPDGICKGSLLPL